MKITIGVSNRHIHLTREDCDKLFGSGFELEKLKDINQPGQYASTGVVTIKTSKSTIENVRVIGPLRSYSQIEISRTDAYKLGINPPVRDSGDIKGSEVVTVIGPKGEVEIEGCIIARRHIHVTEEEKEKFGFFDFVTVKYEGDRGGLFENVFIKVDELSYFEFHIDTDEANAFGIKNGDEAEVIYDKKNY